jgi:RNA polymerase sigma factor (sigma-70 family)
VSRALSDGELVAGCLRGDASAWVTVVERYGRYVMAIAVRGHGLSADAAEEVHQEVFVRTYRHLDRLRDPEALRPWIAQLARRISIDQLRAARHIADDSDLDARPAEDMLERLDLALAVRQALEGLPAETAEVLDRFFTRDESYATISDEMGIAPGTVASRISRGLVRLREELA